jgi:hypothetical protein
MNIAREIKINRLLLAILFILLLADTVPHPNLAPGLLQSLASQVTGKPDASGVEYFSIRSGQ